MPFAVRLKFWFLGNHWWIISLILIVLANYLVVNESGLRVAIPTLGTLLSIFYFLQKQKIEEIRLFREIFKDCNSRYDDLNEGLALIFNGGDTPLTSEEEAVLVDYFNLCGEEFLYFKHGFIYPNVWHAWRNGVRQYLNNARIRSFWDKELQTNSYYGIPSDL